MAQKPDGPRGDPDYQGDIDHYDNLILLCRRDHKIIDDQVALWPISRLLSIKREHEERMASEHGDVLPPGLKYLRIERIREMAGELKAMLGDGTGLVFDKALVFSRMGQELIEKLDGLIARTRHPSISTHWNEFRTAYDLARADALANPTEWQFAAAHFADDRTPHRRAVSSLDGLLAEVEIVEARIWAQAW
ncbi:HNH endonuclease signature motif containing protein [Microbispora sp. NPDC004025]